MTNPFAKATTDASPFANNNAPEAENAEVATPAENVENVQTVQTENKTETPTENTMETATTEEVNTEESTENGEEKPKKKRQRHVEKNSPRKTSEQVKYIIAKYKDNSVSDLMADPFLEGLTEQQIRKTVFDTKKALKEKAEAMDDEEKKAQLYKWINENLPDRSADRKGGKRGTVMDSALDDIMSSVFG